MKINMKRSLLVAYAAASFLSFATQTLAINPDQKKLPIGLAPHESVPSSRGLVPSVAPAAPIHSLAEWEDSDAVMTLWDNPSWVGALAANGNVKLIADDSSGVQWWRDWLARYNIPSTSVSYYTTRTDSIWVRDYGPWFVLDGDGVFGIVDTKYNRPRPTDDLFPEFVGKTLGVPVYKPGLVHTGGNYYNDGLDNAFSSTLVYTENSSLSATEVRHRMKNFLGIERYTTSPLAPGITIEHIDTFGKLVAPDTWVFSEFPQNSRYRKDSETMVALLKTLKSPYGTPYKIFRMPMASLSGSSDSYRAYINSFISNRTLYFPTYNTASDATAKSVYESALPGYKVVGVDAMGTEWGDSVHCRSRNLLRKDTIFIFPKVTSDVLDSAHEISVEAEIFASPGATLNTPTLQWSTTSAKNNVIVMTAIGGHKYQATIPPQEAGRLSFHIEVSDSSGKHKTAPANSPAMSIDLEIKDP